MSGLTFTLLSLKKKKKENKKSKKYIIIIALVDVHSLPFSHIGGFCWNRRVKPQHVPGVATAASQEMKSCTKQYEDFLTNCSVYWLVFCFKRKH